MGDQHEEAIASAEIDFEVLARAFQRLERVTAERDPARREMARQHDLTLRIRASFEQGHELFR